MNSVLVVMPLSTLDLGSRSSGGVDSVCQTLIDSLANNTNYKNFEYTIIAFNPFNDCTKEGKYTELTKNLKIYQFNNNLHLEHSPVRIPAILWQNYVIWKILRKVKPSIFHTHLLSWQIFPYKKTKTIATLHAYKKFGRSSVSKINDFFYEKIIPALSKININHYTVVSQRLKRATLDLNKGVSIIYNPLPSKYTKTHTSAESKLKTERINLVTCGNVTKNKGIHHAIEILHKLNQKGAHAHLNIIGHATNNPYLTGLKDQIVKFKLKDNVTFHNQLPSEKILRIYEDSDYGLFLSAEETFGLVPIEMIACGLEVICSRVGIMDDLFHEFSAFDVKIVEQVDSTEISDYIYNSGKCKLDEAKNYILDNFDKDTIIKNYEQLYESILKSDN
ncbi:Glycosyltransferase Gtf1 [Pseudomonas fluorescens]|uniref:VpsD family glycosyltransferase n=1 Tax=Pseudomonas fluorescens TaxID=294 RepID=UPI00123F2F56|nr:VpsD family glycosyltransferase [Pseudomonas fluorescens]VVQ02179.1 Glycosyltransferase Gtf1 [Pseudomonas fluorescens]